MIISSQTRRIVQVSFDAFQTKLKKSLMKKVMKAWAKEVKNSKRMDD